MAQEAMYIEIYNDIKNAILTGQYKLNDMLPTENELAIKYYASRITIRKAMDMLKDEGFIKRIAGRGTFIQSDATTTAQKHKTIGVILCNIGASFGLDILNSIEEKCTERGYNIILKNSRDSSKLESQAIDDLVAAGVSGIIIQPIHREYYNKSLIFHHFNKFPFVLVDRHFVGFNIPSVSTNNLNAATDMTEHILSYGHKEICFISCDPVHTSTIEERLSGFKSTCIMHGIKLTEKNFLTNIVSPHVAPDPTVWLEDVEKIKNHILENQDITCLFSSEFTIAKLINQAMKELKLTIGKDISLVTFDYSESLDDYNLTRVEQNQHEIGKYSAEILLRRLDGENISDRISINHKLILGNSIFKMQ